MTFYRLYKLCMSIPVKWQNK